MKRKNRGGKGIAQGIRGIGGRWYFERNYHHPDSFQFLMGIHLTAPIILPYLKFFAIYVTTPKNYIYLTQSELHLPYAELHLPCAI